MNQIGAVSKDSSATAWFSTPRLP